MWRAWKQNPSDATLEPLLDSLQPLINQKVNEFTTAPVPPVAVRGAANAAVMKALNSYSPTHGAGVGTHVFNHLRKVSATVHKYQNQARIPTHRIKQITPYKLAREELSERLGRPPDTIQLAEYLGWSAREVSRMETELSRQDLIASWDEPESIDDAEESKEEEILHYIHQELDAEERLVFEYTLGFGGKPQLAAGKIAEVMGISKPRVSRIRNKISQKLSDRGI